jgi:hypothetical protein
MLPSFALDTEKYEYPRYLLLSLYLLGLTTVFMPFYFVGINVLFYVTTVISIAGLIVLHPPSFRLYVSKWIFMMLLVYSLSFFLKFNSSRISSYLYALFFGGSFMLVAANLRANFTRSRLGALIRLVIYMNVVCMVLQQACVVLGLPVININPDFSDQFMSELWLFRLNALSSEPSYGATIVVVLAYVYYLLFPTFRGEWLRFWLPAIYLWVFFNSALATLLVPVIVLTLLTGKRWWLMPLTVILAYLLVQQVDSDNRIIVLLQELNIRNFADTFIDVDLSGAFRVVPVLFFAEQANIGSPNFWLGNGIDYGSMYISKLMPGLELDFNFPGGVLPFMLFDYGMLCFLAFCIFLHRTCCTGNVLVFWILAFFVMVNANFNTQLMWVLITYMFAGKMMLEKTNQSDAPDRSALAE